MRIPRKTWLVALCLLSGCGGTSSTPCSPAPVPLFGYNGTFSGTLGESPTPLIITFTQTNNGLTLTGTYGGVAITGSGEITTDWNADITLTGEQLDLTESLSSAVIQIVNYQTCPAGTGETQQVESFMIAPSGDNNPLDASTMKRQ